jgi:lysyl-tRNA synthetase class 2
MMEMVEELLEKVTESIHGKTVVKVGDREIDFAGPYRRLSMYDSIKESIDSLHPDRVD